MIYKSRIIKVLCQLLCLAVALGITGACTTPAEYETQADTEVYKIIDTKWDPNFGQKTNYSILDTPSPNDTQLELPSPQPLNLKDVMAIATANNRPYQTQKEQLYNTALDLTLVRYDFVRQWFGTIDTGYINDADDESIDYSADLGFTQMLADGAVISTNLALDWMRFLTGDPRTSLGSVLSASITQPLLRGAGRKIAQENLTQAERNVLYQIRSFNRFRKTFVVSIVNDYYRVLQSRDAVTNAENDYKTKTKLTERLRMEADEGRTARFQVDQAEQSELNARESYLRAQRSYEQRLDEFKIRLSLPTDAEIELNQNELAALKEIGISDVNYTSEEAIEIALTHRLDLANSGDHVDDSVRNVMVMADRLRAGLNLVGSMSAPSSGETDYGKLEFSDGTYALGLEADLPLDRKEQRNTYRKALISLQQQQRQYANDIDDVKLDVRGAYRKLLEEAESYQTQEKSLELAQTRVDVAPLLWETQRANTRDLLESQDALLEAQNRLTAALVDHAVAKLNFFRDVGILQVRPDGMWEEQIP